MNGLIIWFVGLIAFPILIVCGEGLYWEIRLNIKIRQLKKIMKELEAEKDCIGNSAIKEYRL